MKRNKLFWTALLTALAFVAPFPAKALTANEVKEINKAITTVPLAELPPKAANLVVKAKAKDRSDVALTVVRAVVAKKPASVPAVVGAISKASPENSPAIAAEAATLLNDQAAEIAKAASAGAPTHASKVAAAVSKAVPKSATDVTRAVLTTVPMSAPNTVSEVLAVVPTAKTQIELDPTITRITSSSAVQVGSGSIITVNGTIRGTLPPNPPVVITPPQVQPGRDSQRDYATP